MEKTDMFVIYFAGLVAMQFHPKNVENFDKVDLKFFANVAKEMVGHTIVYSFQEDQRCPG